MAAMTDYLENKLIDAFEWRAGIHELIAEDAAGIDTLLLHGCTTVAP